MPAHQLHIPNFSILIDHDAEYDRPLNPRLPRQRRINRRNFPQQQCGDRILWDLNRRLWRVLLVGRNLLSASQTPCSGHIQ